MFTDWKLIGIRYVGGASRVMVSEEGLGKVRIAFLRLQRDKRTCALMYTSRLQNKVEPYDEFYFLQGMLKKFPQLCRFDAGLMEQFVTEDMLKDESYDISDRLKLLRGLKIELNQEIHPVAVLEKMDDELELAEDYLEYIEAADDFEIKESLDNDDFRDRFMENISREIDNVGSDYDMDGLEEKIREIGYKFPDWDIDFEEEIAMQRMKLSERYFEREQWEDKDDETTPMDEDSLIAEMFTSLRIKEE